MFHVTFQLFNNKVTKAMLQDSLPLQKLTRAEKQFSSKSDLLYCTVLQVSPQMFYDIQTLSQNVELGTT